MKSQVHTKVVAVHNLKADTC